MDKPKVSVIIPAYNASKTIETCLDSIRNQSFTEIEVIVVDDCSSDATHKLVEKEANGELVVRLIRLNKNAGAYMARIAGIKAAQAEWLAFIDADDIAEKQMIEILYNAATENSADIAVGGVSLADKKHRYLGKKVCFRRNTVITSNPLFHHCMGEMGSGIVFNKLYHRKVLKSLQKLSTRWRVDISEDNIFNLLAFFEAQRVIIVATNIIQYVIHEKGVTGSTAKAYKLFGLLKAYAQSLLFFEGESQDVHQAITIYFRHQLSYKCYAAKSEDILLSSVDAESVISAIISVYPLGLVAMLSRNKIPKDPPNTRHSSTAAKVERLLFRLFYKMSDKLYAIFANRE
jgi:glycosyltransferase involved in cell wall biosynthesis